MSAFVLDASVAVTWLVDDEDHPLADAARRRIVDGGAFVPQVWHLEVRNALLVAELRRRITAGGTSVRLRSLKELPIHTDTEPDLEAALELARGHDLTIYDAVYLELARRRDEALATLDTALARAAAAAGVVLVTAS
ncbi:MAG: type II toxin-antitoxin system VapC family toxin [Chromatiales bacterium]|nr:type II toxin-antitoxin system VapC family toxin [Chromatiales bacterium]